MRRLNDDVQQTTQYLNNLDNLKAQFKTTENYKKYLDPDTPMLVPDEGEPFESGNLSEIQMKGMTGQNSDEEESNPPITNSHANEPANFGGTSGQITASKR